MSGFSNTLSAASLGSGQRDEAFGFRHQFDESFVSMLDTGSRLDVDSVGVLAVIVEYLLLQPLRVGC